MCGRRQRLHLYNRCSRFPGGRKHIMNNHYISMGTISVKNDTTIWGTHLEGGDVRSVGIWWKKNHTSTFPPEIKIISHVMKCYEISPVIQSMTSSTVSLGQAWSDLGVYKIGFWSEGKGRQRFCFGCCCTLLTRRNSSVRSCEAELLS